MAVQVNNPVRQDVPNQPQAREKDSDLDKILKALQVANFAFGIASDVDKIRTGSAQRDKLALESEQQKMQNTALGDVIRRDKENILTSDQQLKLGKAGYNLSSEQSPGAIQFYSEDDKGAKSPLYASLKKPADDPLKAAQIQTEKFRGQKYAAETKNLAGNNQKTFSNEQGLRKEINNLPEIKNYKTIVSGYKKMESGANRGDAVGDMALVYGFMKIQDPTSTVREGEYATAEQTAGLDQKIVRLYNKLKDGERLSPEQRQNFLQLGRAQVNGEMQTVNSTLDRYDTVIKNYGLNRDNIITFSPASIEKQKSPGKNSPLFNFTANAKEPGQKAPKFDPKAGFTEIK